LGAMLRSKLGVLVASSFLFLSLTSADRQVQRNNIQTKFENVRAPSNEALCPKNNRAVVVYENFFEDDFQHDHEERSHPESVFIKEGSLSLNGSADTTSPLWRVNIQPEHLRDDKSEAICISMKKRSKWGDIGFEIVLADSDGEIVSVGYARSLSRREALEAPLSSAEPELALHQDDDCWTWNAGRTFLARKDGACSTADPGCCTGHVSGGSAPTADTWVEDALCYAPSTGVAWLLTRMPATTGDNGTNANKNTTKYLPENYETPTSTISRPSSGRGFHVRLLWQQPMEAHAKRKSNSNSTSNASLRIDDLQIYTCMRPRPPAVLPRPLLHVVDIGSSDEASTQGSYRPVLPSHSPGQRRYDEDVVVQAERKHNRGPLLRRQLILSFQSFPPHSTMFTFGLLVCCLLMFRRLRRSTPPSEGTSQLPVHCAPGIAPTASDVIPRAASLLGGGGGGSSLVKEDALHRIGSAHDGVHCTKLLKRSVLEDSANVGAVDETSAQAASSNTTLSSKTSPSSGSKVVERVDCATSPYVSAEGHEGNEEGIASGGNKPALGKMRSASDLVEHIQAHLAAGSEGDSESWRIPSMDEVTILGRVDEGHYGEVFRAKWRGCEVAVKRIKMGPALWEDAPPKAKKKQGPASWEVRLGLAEARDSDDISMSGSEKDDISNSSEEHNNLNNAHQEEQRQRLAESFARELSLLKRLRSNRIVLFMGACLGPPDLCLVTEYLPRGSLHDLLHRKKKLPKGRRLLQMARDIAEGCAYLHAERIVHRDLKASNLLLDENYRVKVADFGLSRIRPGSVEALPTASWAGTIAYMAPEILRGDSGCTEGSDIYSFGVVLWEMVTGHLPWRGLESWQVMQRMGTMGESLPVPAANSEESHLCPPALLELMAACLDHQHVKRPTFQEVLIQLDAIQLDANAIRTTSSGELSSS